MSTGPLSPRALNRATLARQLLLAREPLSVTDAVRRTVAIQAQQPASPYVALWNRLSGFDPAKLDAAFADRAIVRSGLLRMTLHAVLADEYATFREAMDPWMRATKLGKRFTASGIGVDEADALVRGLVDFATEPRTAVECAAWLAERLGERMHDSAWQVLRQYAPLLRAPTGAAWQFGQKISYVAPTTRPALGDPDVAAEAMKVLARRYLEGFGPASVADLARFTLVPPARAKAAVAALGDELERLIGPDGTVLYDVPGAARPGERVPAPPRLLAMWDSILFAYVDRGRVIPPDYRAHVIRVNGDSLPTLLVDGYVAGVWRQVDEGIEATAFHPLPKRVWKGLELEARSLLAMIADREPRVYSYYHRWWSKLPCAEVRVLRGQGGST